MGYWERSNRDSIIIKGATGLEFLPNRANLLGIADAKGCLGIGVNFETGVTAK